MPLIKPKDHTVVDMYIAWCDDQIKENPNYRLEYDNVICRKGIRRLVEVDEYKNKKTLMTYTLFRMVIEQYNTLAVEAIIDGNRFDLGGSLGYLFGARVERNFNKPKVDVANTVRLRKTNPEHPAVYHTDDDYCMIKWQKYYRIKNESVYSFVGAKYTVRQKFSHAIQKNPELKSNFRFYPFIRDKQPKEVKHGS